MYSNPHWRYSFNPQSLTFAESLVRLHYIQPGAKVHLKYGNRQPQLVRCIELPSEAIGNYAVWDTWWKEQWPVSVAAVESGLDSIEVIVPHPIVEGVDEYLTAAGLMETDDEGCFVYCTNIQPVNVDGLLDERVDGIDVSSLFVDARELMPGFVESLRPFQPSAIYHCSVNPYALIVWACGAGKTRAAIGGALTRQGNILIIAPSRACYGWYREFREITTLDPYMCKSASKRRKKDIPLSQYMYGWKKDGKRRIVIAPLENIGAFSEELKRGGFTVLILDEIHEMGDPKRWTVTTDESGNTTVTKRTTAKAATEESEDAIVGSNYSASASDKLTRAVTLMELSQLLTLCLRIGLSATPLGDGRHQRLWAPLDLLDPGGLGTFSEYKARYCLNDKEPVNSFTGRLNDNGSSCKDELKQRSRFYLHEVTYSETHACMPPLTIRFVRLRIEDQNKPDAMKRQISAAERLLASVKGKSDDEEAASKNLAQLRLAEASTTKRKYVIRESIEVLKGGGHVAIMTGQIKDTEKWAEEFAIELSKLREEHEWAREAQLFFGHGSLAQQGHELLGNVVDWGSDAEARARMVREGYGGTYRHSPAVFIGTHQAFGASINGLEWTHRAFQVMLPWSGDDAVQVRGRWDRGGFPTLYDIIVSQNTYDERVQFIVMAKLGVATSYTKSEEARDMLKAANTFDSSRINEEFNKMLLDEDELFDM